MVEGTRENFAAKEGSDVSEDAVLTADAGYHTEKNMEMLAQQGIDACVADPKFRKRDERFAEVDRYKKRPMGRKGEHRGKRWFTVEDFG